MTGEIWGGITAFILLSSALLAIWRFLDTRLDNMEKRLNERVMEVEMKSRLAAIEATQALLIDALDIRIEGTSHTKEEES